MDAELVAIRRYQALIHAELAKSALEAYEVDAAINGGSAIHNRYRTAGDLFELLVRAEDVERALEILGPDAQVSN